MTLKSLSCAAVAILVFTGGVAAQDWSQRPTYGARSLSTSAAETINLNIDAGGNIPVGQTIGAPCVGMVANAPDFRLMLQGDATAALRIQATSSSDTTLVVSRPDGSWICDDDSGGNLDPLIISPFAQPGQYDIWVGTYSSGMYPPAMLSVSVEPTVSDRSRDRGRPAGGDRTAMGQGETFWYADGGQPVGPVPLAAIEAAVDEGTISRNTMVWQEGMPEWVAAETVPSVDALFPVEPPPLPQVDATPEPPALPPATPPSMPPEAPATSSEEDGSGEQSTEGQGVVPGGPKGATADDPAADDVTEDEAPTDDSGQEGEGADTSRSDDISTGSAGLLAACMTSGMEHGFQGPEEDLRVGCDCAVTELLSAELDSELLQSFANDFEAASGELESTHSDLYNRIDEACFQPIR